MQDWPCDLEDSAWQASNMAGQPTFRLVSHAFRSGNVLSHCSITKCAIARLTDIAILTVDAELAAIFAARSDFRPLRRWMWQDLINVDLGARKRVCRFPTPGPSRQQLLQEQNSAASWGVPLYINFPFGKLLPCATEAEAIGKYLREKQVGEQSRKILQREEQEKASLFTLNPKP